MQPTASVIQIKVSVQQGDKVSDIKQIIEEELRVPCDRQRLFLYNGDGELEDDEDALSRVTHPFITWLIRNIVLIQRDEAQKQKQTKQKSIRPIIETALSHHTL